MGTPARAQPTIVCDQGKARFGMFDCLCVWLRSRCARRKRIRTRMPGGIAAWSRRTIVGGPGEAGCMRSRFRIRVRTHRVPHEGEPDALRQNCWIHVISADKPVRPQRTFDGGRACFRHCAIHCAIRWPRPGRAQFRPSPNPTLKETMRRTQWDTCSGERNETRASSERNGHACSGDHNGAMRQCN
jgi:hypothetical protein